MVKTYFGIEAMPDHPRHYMWKSQDKRQTAIKDMGDTHLGNTIEWIIRNMEQLRLDYNFLMDQKDLRKYHIKELMKLRYYMLHLCVYKCIMEDELAYREQNPHEQRPRRSGES